MKRNLFVCLAAMGIACGLASSAFAEDPYVQSDGTQAVVLDYFANPNTKIEVDFALTDLRQQTRVFGESGLNAGVSCALYISGGNVYSWGFQNGDGDWQWTSVAVSTDRRTFVLDGPNRKVQVIKDGVVEDTKTTVRAVTATAVFPLALFASCQNEAGTLFNHLWGKMKLYSFKVYESETIVMDLQPVLKNGVYLLKDAVTGKVYGPTVGNPLTGGGDIATETGELTWTGMESADWNAAGNWQDAGGSPAAFPPRAGDAAVIPAGSAVDIGGVAVTVKSLTLRGGGTVTLTGTNAKPLADSLVVESGTTLSLASGTTVYVPAATAGGASVPAGRHAGGSQSWLAGSGTLNVNFAGAFVSDNVLTLDAPAGRTISYYTQLASPITKVVKVGAGTAIVSNDNNSAWVGTVDIKEGILEAQSAVGAAGTIPVFGRNAANTITVFKGAQLHARVPGGQYQNSQRFQNDLVLAGEGPDGYGALRLTRYAVSGSHASFDRLFTNVTLTDDATVYNGNRMGFTGGTVNLNGHKLWHRPRADGSSEFMLMNTTVKNGSLHARNSCSMTTQGTVRFQGSADNTITIDSGSYLSIWNVTFSDYDWTTVQKGGSWLRAAGGDALETRNRILGPLVLESGTVTLTNYSPSTVAILNLNGPVSGAGQMLHNGNMNTYLRNSGNTWTGGINVRQGTVWGATTGSIPPGSFATSGNGAINFVAKDWDLAAMHNVLTNWNGSGAVNVYTAAGEALTDDVDFEYPAPYRHGGPGTLVFAADTTPEGMSRLINGEGEMVVAGDKTRYLTQLNVLGGTMTLENAGRICAYEWDVANNRRGATNKTWTVGGSNGTTPARMVVKSGTALDAYVTPYGKSGSRIYVQDSGTKGAILELHEGGAITNWLGVGTSGKGAYYQYGGTLRNICCNAYDSYVGNAANSYGFVDIMGGDASMRTWWRFGRQPTGVGVMRMSGGTFRAESCMILGCGGWGELYMTGGTYNGGTFTHLGEQQWGESGASGDKCRGALTLGGEGNPRFILSSWLDVCERTNRFVGVVNMNAGVLSTPTIQKGDWGSAARDNTQALGFVNFGGGTWQAYASHSAIFGAGVRVPNRVTVFPGGATLDINGMSSSNGAVPFEKPFGKGVASIAWPAGTVTNGYIGPPEVYITGGGGTGAVAHCTFDARTGTIGEIVMGSPGWGYTSAPTVTIKNAGRTADIACVVTLTDGEEQPGGGLTLTNSSATAGTFTLSAANTYTGATVVAGGTLKLGAADAIPSANEVRLAGGTFDAGSFTPSYARVGGYGTLKGNVTVTDKLVFDAAQPPSAGLTVNGSLTLGSGVTVEIANTNLLTRGTIHTLATFPTPLASVPASNLTKPWCVFLTNGGKTLKMHYQAGTMFLIK